MTEGTSPSPPPSETTPLNITTNGDTDHEINNTSHPLPTPSIESPADVDHRYTVKSPSHDDARFRRRVQKWDAMMIDWDHTLLHHRPRVLRRLRKGIPDIRRAAVWNRLGNVTASIQKHPDVYNELSEAVLVPRVKDVIERDMHRTFPGHPWLAQAAGQEALRRVLTAYAAHDPATGYCQGMNFIAGLFLSIFVDEEQAFWMLVFVMTGKPCQMRGMFSEGMVQTHKTLHIAERLLERHCSSLARHFQQQGVHVTMFATAWLLTQFTSSFPFGLVVRVWDAFLFEGWKISYRVLLAILQSQQLESIPFEDILVRLRDCTVDTDAVMKSALRIRMRWAHIRWYEKQWKPEHAAAPL